MKKIFYILLVLLSLIIPPNSFADQITINNFSIFNYPAFDFSGDFIAGSGISQDDRKSLIPVGTVSIWTQEEIPEFWLECDGSAVDSAKYPELRKLMSHLPDYRGMFLRGAGSQTINHGDYGSVTHSAELGKVQGDSIRNITGEFSLFYGLTSPSGVFTSVNRTVGIVGGYGIFDARPVPYFNASRVVPTSTENRPVNVGVKYIIKAE